MILTPPPTGGQQILRHALGRRWRTVAVAHSSMSLRRRYRDLRALDAAAKQGDGRA